MWSRSCFASGQRTLGRAAFPRRAVRVRPPSRRPALGDPCASARRSRTTCPRSTLRLEQVEGRDRAMTQMTKIGAVFVLGTSVALLGTAGCALDAGAGDEDQ